MRCKLEKQVDHSTVKKQFRDTYIHCPLLAKEDKGMNSLGVLCGGCCLRIQQLIEAKKDLLLRQVFSVEDYKRNPDLIMEYLPERLQGYYVALRKLGKTVDDASSECGRCKAMPIDYAPTRASKATEMTECGRNDLR
jgi:hypothetical protein